MPDSVGGQENMAKKLKENGLSDFQIRVLLELTKVPRGSTVTYKALARMAGRPNAYRAVGTAVRKNPFAPTIPCHRVVKSDGTIGNYSVRGGTRRKMQMLKFEGAAIAEISK
jgi:O-6-methylguanine DNA methyltransferase